MRQSSYSTYHQVARSPGGARPGPPASLHPFTQQSFSMPAPVSQARRTSPFSALSIWEVGTREDEAIALRMWLESHLVCARPPLGLPPSKSEPEWAVGRPKHDKVPASCLV